MIKAEIIGNLGNDAENKVLNGKNYISFNVAHSEKRKGQQTTVWVSCLMNESMGHNLEQYLKKGCKVFVRGTLATNPYTDRSGNPQCGLNVYVSEIQMCGSKADAQPPVQTSPSAAPAASTQQADPDDDLPF